MLLVFDEFLDNFLKNFLMNLDDEFYDEYFDNFFTNFFTIFLRLKCFTNKSFFDHFSATMKNEKRLLFLLYTSRMIFTTVTF